MKTLILLPTYNEVRNISGMTQAIWQHLPGAHILIIDDNSPDGTGQVADHLAATTPEHLFVLHRDAKQGLGRAYLAGFTWALQRDYQSIFAMDADFSHQPAYLPTFLHKAQETAADVVLGSRYLPGGGVPNWGMPRRWLSRWGNRYAQRILALPLTDITGGFKYFRRHVLEALDLAAVQSRGYLFQVDITYRVWKMGYRIEEIPIVFHERQAGVSKMSLGIIWEALWHIWKLKHVARPSPKSRPACETSAAPELKAKRS